MIVYCESVFVSFIILKSMVLIHPMRYRNIIRQHLGLQSLLSPIIQDIRLLWLELTSKPTYSIEFIKKKSFDQYFEFFNFPVPVSKSIQIYEYSQTCPTSSHRKRFNT